MSPKLFCGMLAAGISLAALPALAGEKKIKKQDLPAAVQKTVEAQTKGATIGGFAQETKGGRRTTRLK